MDASTQAKTVHAATKFYDDLNALQAKERHQVMDKVVAVVTSDFNRAMLESFGAFSGVKVVRCGTRLRVVIHERTFQRVVHVDDLDRASRAVADSPGEPFALPLEAFASKLGAVGTSRLLDAARAAVRVPANGIAAAAAAHADQVLTRLSNDVNKPKPVIPPEPPAAGNLDSVERLVAPPEPPDPAADLKAACALVVEQIGAVGDLVAAAFADRVGAVDRARQAERDRDELTTHAQQQAARIVELEKALVTRDKRIAQLDADLLRKPSANVSPAEEARLRARVAELEAAKAVGRFCGWCGRNLSSGESAS